MQDIQGIGGGGGRLFTAGAGGSGGGDRRLRQHNHLNHQQLKCPRCDSLSTKFCYYNNYNLSQPRHFCKSCRRYWTKGGVLRNVPVGGGCRKSKRSKPKSSASTSSTADTVQHEPKSNSHSSSESSSLTATTTTVMANTTTGATAEVASATNSNLLNFTDASSFFPPKNATNPSFDHQPLIDHHTSDGSMFTEVGSLTNMMTSTNESEILTFEVAGNNNSAYRLRQNDYPPVAQGHSSKIVGSTTNNELKIQEINTTAYLDQTVQIDLEQSRVNNGGLEALDWQHHRAAEQGMFDFTGAVDQAYWSQTQWPDDNDQSLNFLP